MFRMTRKSREKARRDAAIAEYQDCQAEATNVLRLIQERLNRRETAELPTLNFAHVGDMTRVVETLSDIADSLTTHEDQ
jgi:hypothetical protein